MNKWKKGFTAEEASLIAVGITGFDTLKKAQHDTFKYQDMDIDFLFEGTAEELEVEYAERNKFAKARLASIREATEIYHGLWQEVKVAYRNRTESRLSEISSNLVILHWDIDPQFDCPTVHTTITKESLAEWFYQKGDTEKAKLFNPQINPESAASQSNSTSELMEIAQKVWDKHYRHLGPNDKQPTKSEILNDIRDEYPELSDNQISSLYVVTRKNHGEK